MGAIRLASGLILVLISTTMCVKADSPKASLTQSDKSRILDQLKASKTADGTFGSARETYFGLTALKTLGERTKMKKICKALLKDVSSESVEDIYYLSKLGCVKASKTRLDAIQTSLDSGIMADQYMALIAAETLKSLDEVSLDSLKSSMEILLEKGAFKATKASSRVDAASTAFGISILSKLGLSGVEAAGKAILKLGKSVGGETYFTAPGYNRLHTTTLVMDAALAAKAPISKNMMNGICSFVIASKYVQAPQDVANLFLATSLCSSNDIYVPVVLGVKDLTITVSDVSGNELKPSEISLESVTTHGSSSKVSVGALNGAKLPELAPGIYDVNLKATVGDSEVSGKSTVRVPATLSPSKVSVVVSSSKSGSSSDDEHVAKFPSNLPEELQVDESKYILLIDLAVKGVSSGVAPEQVALLLTHVDTGTSTMFPMNGSKGKYSLKLNMGSPSTTSKLSGSGMYTMYMMVGGVLLKESFKWELGDVDVRWPPSNPTASLMDELKPKKEIRHIFNNPDPRPLSLFSLVFTILCLAPLGILILGINYLGFGLKFSSVSQSKWAIPFLTSLVAVMFLNVFYFLVLNTFEAFAGLGILAIPAIITGHGALNALNLKRTGGDKEKTE